MNSKEKLTFQTLCSKYMEVETIFDYILIID